MRIPPLAALTKYFVNMACWNSDFLSISPWVQISDGFGVWFWWYGKSVTLYDLCGICVVSMAQYFLNTSGLSVTLKFYLSYSNSGYHLEMK